MLVLVLEASWPSGLGAPEASSFGPLTSWSWVVKIDVMTNGEFVSTRTIIVWVPNPLAEIASVILEDASGTKTF